MKKWFNFLFVVFFILCLGIIIGIFSVVVNCCSGNSELMYDGILDNTKIQIEKDLGNATMASYMTVYVDGKIVYDNKCFVRDTVEDVIWHKKLGILQVILRQKVNETSRDTITVTVKGIYPPIKRQKEVTIDTFSSCSPGRGK